MTRVDTVSVKVYNAAQIKAQEVFNPKRVVQLMIKFKVCPRCHGDLYLNEDNFGKYLNCLQCGYMKDAVTPTPNASVISGKPAGKQPVAAGRKAA